MVVLEAIKSVLVGIATQLRRDVLSKTKAALSEDASTLSQELQCEFNSLAMLLSKGNPAFFLAAKISQRTKDSLSAIYILSRNCYSFVTKIVLIVLILPILYDNLISPPRTRGCNSHIDKFSPLFARLNKSHFYAQQRSACTDLH
jgi:hypothetical protein